MGKAAAVGAHDRELLVAARHQPDFGLRAWLSGRQRMHENVDAVMRRVGGKPEIGDDEPLRRQLIVVRAQVIL